MPENSHFLNNPLAAVILLMAAYTPDPVQRLNALSQTVNSMREAMDQINTGLAAFNTEVMPMFMRTEKETASKKPRR